MTVNFDNAATTYPKPPEVRRAVADAVVRYGNAGRGGHVIAERTSELVYHARETVAEFFDAKVENTIFTLNLSLIHISEPTRPAIVSRMPSSA